MYNTEAVHIANTVNTRGDRRADRRIALRDLHGDGDDWDPVEPAGIPRGWRLLLRDSRGGWEQMSRNSYGDGRKFCGTPPGM